MNTLNIGLDIDGVLADFRTAWFAYYSDLQPTTEYHFDDKMFERFDLMKKAGTLDGFFLGLKPLINPEDLPFEPKCYITARPVETAVTELWLKRNGFPKKKVYTVPIRTSKVAAAKEAGIEIFVDDYYKNFKELNDAGILTYLYSVTSNLKYDVGELRLNSLKDILLLQQ
jgi:hypothetical protein